MLYVKPDFYDDFHCIASRCRHSCCLGWEIDIDQESLSRFMAVEGDFGDFMRKNIELSPTPHFVLSADERCPFLQSDGLCRMILSLGEDSLCDICREHPRFYNELPGRLESGLGLSCEEAARLLREGEGHLELIFEGDAELAESFIIPLRQKVFDALRDESLSASLRMEKAMALFGMELMAFDADRLRDFYMGLERLEEDWTDKLRALRPVELEPALSGIGYLRLAEYFVYRHLPAALNEYEAGLYTQFAFLSARLVCALDLLTGDTEAARLYSAEIEYSDENVELVLDYIEENIPD